jgi:citrate lyase subunit beta/citryl-CoA lyase
MLRSMLFIPGDSEKKLAKADDVKADALILDLEDSVAAPRKEAARGMIREFLRAHPRAGRRSKLYVRVNPLESDAPLRDLAAVVAGNPDGIVFPKASGPAAVARLADYLDALEVRDGITEPIRIVAIAGESAEGVLALGDYAKTKTERLVGLSWGPWDLAADIGAAGNRDANGAYEFTYKMAMSLTLLAAKAAGLQAIDTPYTDFKDEKGLLAACKAIRRDGWTGKLAIHPAQVAVIHEGFRPTPEEVSYAERVVQAFTTITDGVVSLDGVMLDLPHLKQARQVLALRDAG